MKPPQKRERSRFQTDPRQQDRQMWQEFQEHKIKIDYDPIL